MLDFSVAALPATDKITELGSYAGIAAILGLAVLSVLYFAQARELKRLREWAGRAPERAAEMQERLLAGVQRPVAAQPPAATPAVRKPVTAPATTAAAAVATKSPATATAAAGPVTAGVGAAAPAATVPPAVQGSSPVVTAEADDATQAIPVVAVAAPRPQPAVPPRPASAAALPPLRRTDESEGDGPSSTRTILAVVGGGVGVIAIAILLATQVFGVGGNDKSSAADGTRTATGQTGTTATTTPTTTSTPAAAQVSRGEFKIYVLNSTQRNGAARDAANKLEGSGYQIAGTGQAVTQTMSVTQVAFKQGSKRAALDVATLLGVSPANVIPADQSTLVAGGMANVVVTLGADKVQ